jgi:hypothetical protein
MTGQKCDALFSAVTTKPDGMPLGLKMKNIYRFEAWEGKPHESKLLWVEEVENLTTNQGLNDNLTKYFTGSAYTAAWYCGLVDNTGFSAFNATDIAANITTTTPSGGTNQWQENEAYTQSVRQTITFGSASGQSISNSGSPCAFTINASVTIYGGFVISNDTKGGTTGVLYGEGAFASPQVLSSGNTLTVTVTCTAASS